MGARPSAKGNDTADLNGRALPLAAAEDRRMSGSAPEELERDLPARSRIISPSLLLPAEVVLFEIKPALWYVVFLSLPIAAAGFALVLLACAFDIDKLVLGGRSMCMVVGSSVMGLRIAIALLQWLGRTYVLTDRRILMQSGVVNVEVECMGLEQIENTFVAQATGQRVLGIGTIFFRCDGAARESLAWEHIRQPKEVHAQIVAQIDRWKRSLNGVKRP